MTALDIARMRMMGMAARLAERHVIPKSGIVHPRVFVHNADGTVDQHMTDKLREPDYVPYCMKTADCARVRRRTWGFECPYCGNKMNWDLTHFNENQNVVFDNDGPPVLSIKEWNERVDRKKAAKGK